MERGTIHSIDSATDSADAELDLPWVAPGLIDLQVNGFGGIAFNAPTLSPEQSSKSVWPWTHRA
jgi:N-acetylglucosamine-6-phosphate deacetylase